MVAADNFNVDITGANLRDSLALAFGDHKTVSSFRVEQAEGKMPICYLFTDVPKDATPFIAPLGVENTAEVVKTWLKSVDYIDNDPYFDGSTDKGWRVFTKSWWAMDGYRTVVCAVEPAVLYYSK